MAFKFGLRGYMAAACIALSSPNSFAQHDMGIERSWPPVSCSMDLGSGVSVAATPMFKGGTLSGITLAFSHASESNLRLQPARFAFFTLPDGNPIQPTAERTLAPVANASGRTTESMEFSFPKARAAKNIAFAFGESAISLRFGDRRQSFDRSSKSMRLMDIASQTSAPGSASFSHPCPDGVLGWQSSEPIERRLVSRDLRLGLEAAAEILPSASIEPPEHLILAAYQLWRDGRAEEAVYWLARGIFRASYSGKTGPGYGYYVGMSLPIVDYARARSPLWAESLRQAVRWDDATYRQWEEEQEEITKNRPTWLKKRAYQREDTLAYARQLMADPKAPPLNPICPICPPNPLRQALEEGTVEQALEIVRNQKIDLNRQYPFDNSYLHMASYRGNLELINALIDRGANTEATDNLGSTPLGWARDVKTLQALLDKGANVNAQQGLDRQTLLLSLISSGTQQGLMRGERAEADTRIALLLKYGADTNVPDAYGRTPLHVAAARGDESLMGLLLGHGANVNAATTTGRDRELANTPLSLAKDVVTASYLIKKGASLKPANADAPLLYAIKAGNIDLVKLLLDIGSDPNSAGGDMKFNALFYAMSRRDAIGNSMAEMLIKNGANPNAIVMGKPIIALAKDYGNEAVVKALQQAGAK